MQCYYLLIVDMFVFVFILVQAVFKDIPSLKFGNLPLFSLCCFLKRNKNTIATILKENKRIFIFTKFAHDFRMLNNELFLKQSDELLYTWELNSKHIQRVQKMSSDISGTVLLHGSSPLEKGGIVLLPFQTGSSFQCGFYPTGVFYYNLFYTWIIALSSRFENPLNSRICNFLIQY